MSKTWIVLAATAFFAACSEEHKPYQPPLPRSNEKTATPLLQPQREALDAARGLGQTIEQGAKIREDAAEKTTN